MKEMYSSRNPGKRYFDRLWVVLIIAFCLVLACSCDVEQKPFYQRALGDIESFSTQVNYREERVGLVDAEQDPERESRNPFITTSRLDRKPDEYYVWETAIWFGEKEKPMTPELCQDWMDWFQADTTFFAIRFPVLSDGRFSSDAITMPVTFQAPFTPTLGLLDETVYPPTEIFTVPMVSRPDLVALAEAELPAKQGEQWLVLGVAPTPAGLCPPALDLPAGEWEFQARVWFDFGGTKKACVECVLQLYYCQEGQESPFFLDRTGRDTGSADGRPVHEEEITAVGPHPIRLRNPDAPSPSFYIQGGGTGFITPPRTITVEHYLINGGLEPVSVTLDLFSKQDLNWGIYSGTFDAPAQPLTPISDPVYLVDVMPLWLITDVPPGASDGSETVIITATGVLSPSQSTWASDIFWIGEWVPPSGQTEWDYLVYLPLVLR